MIKPQNLVKGDKVAIVSLSSGLLGEDFVKHELDLAIKRLKDYGLEPVIMPNACKGIDYLATHPEARAKDLKQAFMDRDIKAIICAIGGDDTFRLLPYLMEDDEFKQAVIENPKIFTGFSDTTINHLMLYQLGLMSFYGPTLLVDLAELDKEMLPYTKEYFEKFFQNEEEYEIRSSEVWYSDRGSYGIEELGVPREKHQETHGYEVLNGSGIQTGTLCGGCIESIYDFMTGDRYHEENIICEKYHILPSLDEWQEMILFLETSEEKPTPEKLEEMLMEFKRIGILTSVKGVIVGKPIDEVYYEEYKVVYKNVFCDLDTPVLYNVNFGHSVPRCILPYGALATIDFNNKTIMINEQILENRKLVRKK